MVKGSRSRSNEGDPAPQGWAGQGDVWIVDLGSGQTTVLPGLSIARRTVPQFTDMGWSPDDTKLALANGQISLYSTLTDRLETLESSTGVHWLTWSPHGTEIAYQQDLGTMIDYRPEHAILITELDGSANKVVADGFTTVLGDRTGVVPHRRRRRRRLVSA